jgi:hypothetical protein
MAFAAAALLVTTAPAASTLPNLRSVSSQRQHAVVVFALRDLAPGEIALSTSSRTTRSGTFFAGDVRFREWMAPQTRPDGLARWSTRHVLPPGTYYVAISGIVTETDCKPGVHPCREVWSNVRRLVVPRL